jgi:hypothetical protein
MRRLVRVFIVVAVLTALTAPMSLGLQKPILPHLNVADAAGCCPKPTSNKIDQLTTPDSSVCIALPIIGTSKCVSNTGNGGAIAEYLKLILQLLGGGIGLIITLMLIIGGVQYITSAGDPARIKAAKQRIQDALIALFLFLTAYAFLIFIVPGGLFG